MALGRVENGRTSARATVLVYCSALWAVHNAIRHGSGIINCTAIRATSCKASVNLRGEALIDVKIDRHPWRYWRKDLYSWCRTVQLDAHLLFTGCNRSKQYLVATRQTCRDAAAAFAQ